MHEFDIIDRDGKILDTLFADNRREALEAYADKNLMTDSEIRNAGIGAFPTGN